MWVNSSGWVLGDWFKSQNEPCVPSPLGLLLVSNRTGKQGVDLKYRFKHLRGCWKKQGNIRRTVEWEPYGGDGNRGQNEDQGQRTEVDVAGSRGGGGGNTLIFWWNTCRGSA